MEEVMTTSELSGSPATKPNKTGWFRRSVMATAFVAAGTLTLGAATAPAQAQYYGYPYYSPYYAYQPAYHPYYYGYGYGYPAFHVGFGWGGGWRGGWGGWHGAWHH
jgi:hypothetical protein